MGALVEYFFLSLAAVFVIINPLTTAFVFASLLPKSNDAERKLIARRAVVTATAVLITFALLGGLIFQIFSITLGAFRIAGGLILFGIGMNMLNKTEDAEQSTSEVKPTGTITDNISIVPLAIPFISGPGSIATVMVLTSDAAGIGQWSMVFLAILITTVACYFSMVNSKVVIDYLGETGRKILTKVFGLILAVIAVQFVINGVSDAVADFILTRGAGG